MAKIAATQSSGMEVLDRLRPMLRLIGPAGFIFVHNISYRGPEFFVSEYPAEWQAEYERRGYTYFDPVLIHSLLKGTDCRWSEVGTMDLRKVMERARTFGLNYGAVLVRKVDGRRTVLSASRSDRELTDDEMAALSDGLDEIMAAIAAGDGPSLSADEAAVLRCIRDGMSHADTAATLHIAVSTVKARLDRARRKLGAKNATHAVVRAMERQLI